MKNFLRLVVRWAVFPVVVFLGIVTGGVDGFVGWFVLLWMLWRGGPGMWLDLKGWVRWLSGGHLRSLLLRRRGGSHRESLNV